MPGTHATFSVFRNRSFALLWNSQFISYLGSAITRLAASVLVFRETGSALSVGLMMIATTGPTLLVGLIAGVFVDRWDRRRVMIVADLLRALAMQLDRIQSRPPSSNLEPGLPLLIGTATGGRSI